MLLVSDRSFSSSEIDASTESFEDFLELDVSTDEWGDSETASEPEKLLETDPSPPPESYRAELIRLAISLLIAERQRSGQALKQESIERLYAQLRLSPNELIALGREARLAGLMDVDESHDVDELSSDHQEDDESEARSGLLNRMLSHELLSADRERQLARVIQISKALEARISEGLVALDSEEVNRELQRGHQAKHALVLSNIRLAMDVARQYVNRGVDVDDLLQDGVIGLLRATDSFDPELGFRFSTYATWWIRQSIMRAIANTGRQVRLPVHRFDQLKSLRRTVYRLRIEHPQRRISPKEIADRHGWTLDTVGQLLVLDAESFVSLHPSDENSVGVLEQLSSNCPTPEDMALTFDLQEFIQSCLSNLTAREADVLRLRFGLDGKDMRTLDEIGKRYRLTRERIRQIESKGLRKLRLPSGMMVEHGKEFLNE